MSIMTAYSQGPSVTLGNGIVMPQFGIGTFNVPSNEICEVGGHEVSYPFFVSEVYTKVGSTWHLVTLAFTKRNK